MLALLSAVTIKMKPPLVSRIFSMIGFITMFFTIISIKIDQKNSYIVLMIIVLSGVLVVLLPRALNISAVLTKESFEKNL